MRPCEATASPAGPSATQAKAGPASLRLGVVDYLNMRPLVDGLEEALQAGVQWRHGPPSALAGWLEAGLIDVGMVPVAALFVHPEWRVVRTAEGGGSMIGARGAVVSVLALGGGRPDGWRRLRPDSHSVTSNLLARVILERKYGLSLTLGEPIPPDGWTPSEEPAPDEACVLIGSRALRWRDWARDRNDRTVLDLGREWVEWTGLPLVCAVWAARPGVELGDLPERLEDHKRRNRERLPAIAAGWRDLDHDRLTPAEALAYCQHNVAYDLDAAALAGLERLRAEAAALDRR